MKLPKSLIKKYGISKKAWSIFKGRTKGSTTKKRTIKESGNVAKRKSSFGRVSSDLGMIGASMGYGAGREWLNQQVAPLTNKMPGGYLADNVVLGGIGYLLYKGKIPFLNKYGITKELGKSAVIVESALAGVDLKNKFFNKGNESVLTTQNMGGQTIG